MSPQLSLVLLLLLHQLPTMQLTSSLTEAMMVCSSPDATTCARECGRPQRSDSSRAASHRALLLASGLLPHLPWPCSTRPTHTIP
jgi:hypothetical protein